MIDPKPARPPPADSTRALAALAGQKLGNYRLERLVGQGRMGAVYLARDEALLRPTAVKILSWREGTAAGVDPVQWFLTEARLVARINHPRVVQIYGAARQGDLCFLAMEYVPGRSAAAVIEAEGRMAPDAATDVLVQAAAALSAAHRCGVIHRDVKPANLLLGQGGVTKLGDFGMALGPDVGSGTAHLRVGTPFYTAPEIWRGELAGPASDLYSLGATYFHLLTGQPPFPGRDAAEVEQRHLGAPPPDPRSLVPEVPASIAALIQRAMAKAPRDRFASAQDMAWEARRVLQELAVGAGRRRPELAAEEDAPAPPAPAWARALGFSRAPFSAVQGGALPYQGEPLARVAAQLAARAGDDATPIVALTGGPGSGRSLLCRRLAADLAASRFVVAVDEAGAPGGGELVQRVCRIVSGSAGPDLDACLESIADHLEEERRRGGHPPTVIIDAVPSPPPSALVRLAQAAQSTGSFRLVLVGAPGLGQALGAAGLRAAAPVPEIEVPPLDREEVIAYVRSWLSACLAPSAPLLLFTPDALLLLAHRSGGEMKRINRLAENMLIAAAAERRRTLTSFRAWTAPDRDSWAGLPAGALPRCPPDWPDAAAASALDACRHAAGLPPWPRAGAAAAGASRSPEEENAVDLTAISNVPEVKSVLLCDGAGAPLRSVREADVESAAAVAGFLASWLGQIGEELGLGPLHRMSAAGADRVTLLLVLQDTLLSAVIQPAAAFPSAELAIDSLLQG